MPHLPATVAKRIASLINGLEVWDQSVRAAITATPYDADRLAIAQHAYDENVFALYDEFGIEMTVSLRTALEHKAERDESYERASERFHSRAAADMHNLNGVGASL